MPLRSDLKFPHTPNNPSGGTTIQVGASNGKKDDEVIIPAGTVVFNYDSAATGRGINRVPIGTHVHQNSDKSKLIGVSMDGIVDPDSAKQYHESAGRYAVAVSGAVTIFAPIKEGNDYKLPKVLDTLWVESDGSDTVKTSTGHDYTIPTFSTSPGGTQSRKVGVVHWVNDNFKNDRIAEVRVHLDIF